MEVHRASDMRAAAEWLLPFAMSDEARNCLQVEALNRLLEEADGRRNMYLAWAEDRGDVVGVAVRNRIPLLLSPVATDEAVEALAKDAFAAMPCLAAWTAPAETGPKFASAWQRLAGRESHVELRLRAFRLERGIIPPRSAPGEMREYSEEDRDLLVRWHRAATEEMGFLGGPTQASEAVEMLLTECQPFLWWDGGTPVAMASAGPPTPNGGRIHSVYTPPQLRGRGYGINCVAALSQHLLNLGHRFCFLFTLPGISAIYERVGYRPQGDVESWITS